MSDKPATPTPAGDRIAKVIARAGVASRREAEKLIETGQVSVNGKVITSPALNVTGKDRIVVKGRALQAPEPARMWLYHKPTGLVTSHKDEQDRETIFDNLPEDLPRVMSVGRLDLNSEGLLLLTNDGGIKRQLELPSTGWLRKYRVRVKGTVDDAKLTPLRKGVVVDGEKFQPMEVSFDRQQGANAWVTVGLREGKNREIRRAMESIGLSVNRLIRVSYGPFQLGTLKQGEVEEIRRKVMRDQLGLSAEDFGDTDAAPGQKVRRPLRKPKSKGRFGGPGQPGRPREEDQKAPRGAGGKGRDPRKANSAGARDSFGKPDGKSDGKPTRSGGSKRATDPSQSLRRGKSGGKPAGKPGTKSGASARPTGGGGKGKPFSARKPR